MELSLRKIHLSGAALSIILHTIILLKGNGLQRQIIKVPTNLQSGQNGTTIQLKLRSQPAKKRQLISKRPIKKKIIQKKIKTTPKKLQASGATVKNFKEAIVNYAAPNYPRRARRRHMEGQIDLKIKVNPEGQPIAIQVLKSTGHKILDQEALKAVQSWVFKQVKNVTTDFYYVSKSIIFKIQ